MGTGYVKNTPSRCGLHIQSAASFRAGFAERLQHSHVLPVSHDDARKRHAFFVLHGVTDDDEGFRSCLAVRGLYETATYRASSGGQGPDHGRHRARHGPGANEENKAYDAEGQVLTGSFMDYAMPRAEDLCNVVIEDDPVPTPTKPLGVSSGSFAASSGNPCSRARAMRPCHSRRRPRSRLLIGGVPQQPVLEAEASFQAAPLGKDDARRDQLVERRVEARRRP